MFRRRDKATEGSVPEAVDAPIADEPVEPALVEGPRAQGPWDVSEREGVGDNYLDFGALRVRGRVGLQVQIPQEDGKQAGAVVLMAQDAGVELRAFAAARSGGLWDDVRAELAAEVDRLEGSHQEVEGPYGTELHARVPVTMPSGEDGFQPSRIVGVDGPRWMLRATFLGQAALEPDDDGLLMQAFRDVVVVRGDEPRPVREPLVVEVPQQVRDAVERRRGGGDGDATSDSSPTDSSPSESPSSDSSPPDDGTRRA